MYYRLQCRNPVALVFGTEICLTYYTISGYNVYYKGKDQASTTQKSLFPHLL